MTGVVVAVVVLSALLALTATALGVTVVRLRRSRRRVTRLEERVDELVEGTVPARKGPARVAELAVRGVIGTATLVRRQGVGGLLMTSIDELSRWAVDERPEIEAEIDALAGTDGAVTILFSDIVGSTSMNDELGDESWVRLLIAHDTMVRAHVERYRGHIVKSQGDGFMIVFSKPSRAVRAGLAIQRSFSETWSRAMRRSPISVRIGIHTGTVVARGGDYFGRNVAMAARVGATADGGELLVSDEVADALVEDARFLITPARTVELKGFPGRHLLHRVEKHRIDRHGPDRTLEAPTDG